VREVSTAEWAVGDIPVTSDASLVSHDLVLPGSASLGGPVFVMKTGTMLSVSNYVYQDGRITYTLEGGGGGVISSDEVDWSTTTRVNAQRGLRVTLRSGRPSEHPGP
jgi:hypothetical protein